jgi:hypothetical protein
MIERTKTNSGSESKQVTDFNLQPGTILEVYLKFISPCPNDRSQWPMIMSTPQQGVLNTIFNNGDIQRFPLHAKLLRPKINLTTDSESKNDKA